MPRLCLLPPRSCSSLPPPAAVWLREPRVALACAAAASGFSLGFFLSLFLSIFFWSVCLFVCLEATGDASGRGGCALLALSWFFCSPPGSAPRRRASGSPTSPPADCGYDYDVLNPPFLSPPVAPRPAPGRRAVHVPWPGGRVCRGRPSAAAFSTGHPAPRAAWPRLAPHTPLLQRAAAGPTAPLLLPPPPTRLPRPPPPSRPPARPGSPLLANSPFNRVCCCSACAWRVPDSRLNKQAARSGRAAAGGGSGKVGGGVAGQG